MESVNNPHRHCVYLQPKVEKLLGAEVEAQDADLVAREGAGSLFETKVVGVLSPRRGLVDIL